MNEHDSRPARVLICGGGVAALEALLALRELLAIRPHVELVAPNKHFVYQPMAVAEPFGLAETRLFDLESIAQDQSAQLHTGVVRGVDADAHQIELADGERLGYDFAVIAVGARRETWLDGAMSFAGADDVEEVRELLVRFERGQSSRLALVAPTGTSWQLPMYELAMLDLIAPGRARSRGGRALDRDPRNGTARDVRRGREPDAAQPARRPRHPPSDRRRDDELRGRTPTSEQRACAGRRRGDRASRPARPKHRGAFRAMGRASSRSTSTARSKACTTSLRQATGTNGPFKQGGLATKQADAAAEAIAARLGDAYRASAVRAAPARDAAYGPRADVHALGGWRRVPRCAREVGANPLWWPPTKIAGRYLGPYLAFASSLKKHAPLEDRPVEPRGAGPVLDDPHREARELALVFAEADARGGDFRSALAWLDVLERLDGVLPTGYLDRRRAWRAKV